MFYEFHLDDALAVGPECSTARFWCVKTARAMGPDDDLAHRDVCVAPRECFEA